MSTNTDHPAVHTSARPQPAMTMPSGANPGEHSDMSASAGDTAMVRAPGQGLVWPHFATMTLGLWLITSAFANAYGSIRLEVSDVVVGVVVIVFAALSLSHRPFWKLWAPWSNAVVGLWLLFAPLVFWAPTAAG